MIKKLCFTRPISMRDEARQILAQAGIQDDSEEEKDSDDEESKSILSHPTDTTAATGTDFTEPT